MIFVDEEHRNGRWLEGKKKGTSIQSVRGDHGSSWIEYVVNPFPLGGKVSQPQLIDIGWVIEYDKSSHQ